MHQRRPERQRSDPGAYAKGDEADCDVGAHHIPERDAGRAAERSDHGRCQLLGLGSSQQKCQGKTADPKLHRGGAKVFSERFGAPHDHRHACGECQ